MSSPRTWRISSSESDSRSRPSNRTSPLNVALPARVSPRMLMLETLLPEPDSPTMPSERPASTE